MTPKRLLAALLTVSAVLLPALVAQEVGAWPNGPNENPLDDPPSDPSFVQFNADGQVTGGEWNFWSFVPELWADNPGFRQDEIAMGTGLWADKAWQVTPGDSNVLIAVLDSGAYWDSRDLINKYYLNRGELDVDGHRPMRCDGDSGDPMDVNGDGRFNIQDYLHCDAAGELARLDAAPGNGNGVLEPQDLLRHFSDGTDDDGNGYIDDISGWDFFWNDNDAYDDNRFGHGNGEARDSSAEGDNGIDGLGVCPRCTVMMVRAGDSFVADSNDFASGVSFAVDSGAKVIQEALGTITMSTFAYEALEYAYVNNVAVIASAADELSYHHNMPGTANHTIYVHAIVHDADRSEATTFLNYNNCTNYGGQLALSSPGGGCSSEATGVTSGHTGLIYSAALQAPLDPPLSSDEVRGILIMSADDIDVPESRDLSKVGLPCTQVDAAEVCGTDGLFSCFIPIQNKEDPTALPVGECFNTKFPSGEGWDLHFGYGRNNARKSVDMVVSGQIPPEVDVIAPLWFATIDPMRTSTLEISGRIGDRADGRPARYASYAYVVEYALGVDPKAGWTEIATGTTPGITGTLGTLDLTTLPAAFDFSNRPRDPHEDAITLRVRVTATGPEGEVRSEHRKTAFIHHDETLFPAFPVNLGTSGESSPKMWDIDGDGKDEVVIATSNGFLHVFNEDGTEAPGFPVALGWRPGHDPADPANHRGACAYREDKTGCKATNGQMNPDVHQALTQGTVGIADLDNDGTDEIVVSTYDGSLFVFEANGASKAGFPVTTDYSLSASARVQATGEQNVMDHGFATAPVLYDLDGDGDLEIIQTAMDQHVYVWHHDGTAKAGFPVLCRDVEEGNRGARILVTPAVGDIDLDGEPEIITGTNEYYNENEVRFYIIKADGNDAVGGPFELGGPIVAFALIGQILPVVGEGIVSNPVIADINFDGRPEFALEGIAGVPTFYQLNEDIDDEQLVVISRANAALFGPQSNSLDAPAFPLVNHGSVGRLDPSGSLSYVKGTAGFNFASAFAEGGTRLVFDHQLSAWNMNPAAGDPRQLPFIEGFPQKMDDWQFFMNPALADLTGDGLSEVIVGSGGYLVHAFDYHGNDAPGFPKFTGGWIISSPTIGDVDGDGKLDVVTMTRNGWLYLWKTEGDSTNRIDWSGYGHDPRNTNNYATPLKRYSDQSICGNGVLEDGESCDGTDVGDATCASAGNFDGGTLSCTDQCAFDTAACTLGGVNNATNNGANNATNNGSNNATNNGTNGEQPPPTRTTDDDGCCSVPNARPTSLPLLPLALLLIGAALLATRRR